MILDIIIFTSIIYSAYKGFRKGIIYPLFSLAGIIIAIYVSLTYDDVITSYVPNMFDLSDYIWRVICLIVTFCMVFGIIAAIGKIIAYFTDILTLGLVNKFSGALLGILKSLLFLSVFLILIDGVNKYLSIRVIEKQIENSVLFKPISNLTPLIYPPLADFFENSINADLLKKTSEN